MAANAGLAGCYVSLMSRKGGMQSKGDECRSALALCEGANLKEPELNESPDWQVSFSGEDVNGLMEGIKGEGRSWMKNLGRTSLPVA